MPDKFTVRDFLVYFITGFFALVALLVIFNKQAIKFCTIEKEEISKNSALIIFFLLPFIYLLGHCIHGIDLIIFKTGRYFWDSKVKLQRKSTKRNLVLLLVNLLDWILNGYRITGVLNYRNIDSHQFWNQLSTLQYEDKSEKAEYWYLMNDLNKGLTLISFCLTIYLIIQFSLMPFIISAILTVIFWIRARHMSVNFVSTTINTFQSSRIVEDQIIVSEP